MYMYIKCSTSGYIHKKGGGGRGVGGLSLSDAGHKEGNVPLYIDREFLHLRDE